MFDDDELELLLSLDGASYEASDGHVVEFKARKTAKSAACPHGLSYALVFRPRGGPPLVRFDNAHGVAKPGKGARKTGAHDHWHRTADDPGRPYAFTTAARLLDDFWREVKRVMDEKGMPNDL